MLLCYDYVWWYWDNCNIGSIGICTGIFSGTYGFVDERDAREEIVEPPGFALSVLRLFVLVVDAFKDSEESMTR